MSIVAPMSVVLRMVLMAPMVPKPLMFLVATTASMGPMALVAPMQFIVMGAIDAMGASDAIRVIRAISA